MDSNKTLTYISAWSGEPSELTLRIAGFYQDGSICIESYEDWEPFGRLTVCLGNINDPLKSYIDVNNMPGIETLLKDSGLAKPTGEWKVSAFCKYPVYEFNLDELRKYCSEDVEKFKDVFNIENDQEKDEGDIEYDD